MLLTAHTRNQSSAFASVRLLPQLSLSLQDTDVLLNGAPCYVLNAICTPPVTLLYCTSNQSTELNHYSSPHHGSSSDVNSWVLMYCHIYTVQQHASTQGASLTHKLSFNAMKPSSRWLGNPSPRSHKSLSHGTRG